MIGRVRWKTVLNFVRHLQPFPPASGCAFSFGLQEKQCWVLSIGSLSSSPRAQSGARGCFATRRNEPAARHEAVALGRRRFPTETRLILPSALHRLCMREPASILSFKAPSG
jgi:hypothetical protein